jgi:RNA polymerase sigma-70 factor (ECF subfamily)
MRYTQHRIERKSVQDPGTNTIANRSSPVAVRQEVLVMDESIGRPTFHEAIEPHFNAGYNLALWLLRDEHRANDAIQDAALKAWRRFDSFRGGDGKAWFLAIVRTSVYDLLRGERRPDSQSLEDHCEVTASPSNEMPPLSAMLCREHSELVHNVASALPPAVREILVLREVEGLSYAQIAVVLGVPVGTVMSRVSRARDAAAKALREHLSKEQNDGV